jgi:hypothetical protein
LHKIVANAQLLRPAADPELRLGKLSAAPSLPKAFTERLFLTVGLTVNQNLRMSSKEPILASLDVMKRHQ